MSALPVAYLILSLGSGGLVSVPMTSVEQCWHEAELWEKRFPYPTSQSVAPVPGGPQAYAHCVTSAPIVIFKGYAGSSPSASDLLNRHLLQENPTSHDDVE